MKLHVDFETRSAIELRDVGLDNYALHPSTSPWCMGYTLDDEEPRIWIPGEDFPADARLLADVVVYAHNAAFELAIWNKICVPRYNWPVLNPSNVRCTMAMAYAMGLPGSLDKAADAVKLDMRKDAEGARLMMQMSRPREVRDNSLRSPGPYAEYVWWDDEAHRHRLYEYCKQDVRVERALEKLLLPLSPTEQRVWELDYEINTRGIPLDLVAVKAARLLIDIESGRLNKEMRKVTDNYVGFITEVARLVAWLRLQGVEIDSLAKADVVDALNEDDLPEKARAALLIRQEAGRTSNAKLDTMLSVVGPDARIRQALQYHGAGRTGRWAGRRIQPQNLPRPILSGPEIDDILTFMVGMPPADSVSRIETLYGPVTSAVSDCLRGLIRAPLGRVLMAGDYSNIEGRGIAWLAGEDSKLDAFRDQDAGTGPEIYTLTASKIYRIPSGEIDRKSPKRQIGKVAELALGYQGGVGAFQRMAKTHGITVPVAEAEAIKDAWRDAHPRIVDYWRALEDAAYAAVLHPGTIHSAGHKGRRVLFRVRGSFLFCLLPSGRLMAYPYPSIKPRTMPWGDSKDCVHYWTVDGLSNKWQETHTFGGKLAENVTQAVCRDILADAMLRVTAAGHEIVLHVHDEIVAEIDEPLAHEKAMGFELKSFLDLMSAQPKWSDGLPIHVDGWWGTRYRK
jgi:DNA polymerase